MLPLRHGPALLALLTLACASAQQVHPRAVAHNDRCAEELTRGELVQAEADCDLGLEYAPRYGNLWVNKGLIAVRAGRTQEAKGHFLKALRYNPEQLQAYQNLGSLYFEEGAYPEAAQQFERALQVDPAFNEARLNLGLTYLRLAAKDAAFRPRARAELQKMLAVDPQSAAAHHALGELAHGERDLEGAASYFRTAVQLAPEQPSAWHDLGVTLLELQRYPEATEAFQECIAHAGDPSCAAGLRAARGDAE